MYYYQQQQQSLTPAAAAPAAATQQQHPPQQQPSMYVMDPSQLAALAHQQQQQYFPPQQQQQMFPSPQQQQFNQTFIPQVGGMPNNTGAAIQYIQMLNLQQHLQQQQQAQQLYSNGANGFAAGQQQQQHQFVGSPSPFPTIFQQPTPAVGGKAPPAPQQYQFSAAGAPTNSYNFSTAAYPHGVAPPPPPPMFGFQPQFAAAPHPNPFGATSVVGLTQNNLQFHNTQPSQQLLPTTAAAAAAAPLQRQNSGRAASTSLTRNASSSLLNLSTTPQQQQQHQQQPQAASIDDPAPCEHNNWDNLRAKNSVVTLCCRDCQKKWKQQFPIRNLCPEFHMRLVCAFGADCPFLHVHRFKSVQKSPNPPGHIVGAVRNPTFAKLAVEVLAEFPGKEPRDVVDEVRARFSLFSDNSSPPSKSDDGHHADDFGEVFGEIGAVHYPMLPTSFFPLESQRDFWAEPSTGDDASDSRSVQTLDAGASPFRSATSPSPSLTLSRGASTYLTQVLSGGVTGDSPQAASTGNNTPPRNVEGAHLANESVIQPPKFQLLTSH